MLNIYLKYNLKKLKYVSLNIYLLSFMVLWSNY